MRGTYRDGRTYRRGDVGYYQQCKRSSSTTGQLAGGVRGALIGSAIGGNTRGVVLSALGGGLLGRSLDKQHDAEQNYRNGC
jgi:outer membrane lipoprotein SlyB